MKFEKVTNSLGRMILLFLIAIAVLMAAVIVWVEIPVFQAIRWHIQHGTQVSYSGHSFKVPLLWKCKPGDYGKGVEISVGPGLSDGAASISLESRGEALDRAGTYLWQSKHITDLNAAIKTPQKITGEVIHGKTLEFICVNHNMESGDDSFSCKVPGTNLTVSEMASTKYHLQARSILETSD